MASYSIITYFSIVVCSIFCMTKYLKVYFWRIFHIKIKVVESLKNVEIFPKSISKVLTDRKDFFNQKSWGKRKVSTSLWFQWSKGRGKYGNIDIFYTEILTKILSCLWRFSRVNRVKKVTIPVKITVLQKVMFSK